MPQARILINDAVALPIRFLSDDGRCAIDVSLSHDFGDVSNGLAFLNAARRILQHCISNQRGGYTSGFCE